MAIELRAGVKHRLRFVSIAAVESKRVRLPSASPNSASRTWLKVEMATLRESIRADISEAFINQTRWMLGGLVLILTAMLFRG